MLSNLMTVGGQVMMLFLMMIAGYCLGKAKLLPKSALASLTNLVIYLALPCMLIGAFEMTSCGNILYIAKIPANLPPKQLHGIIRAVAAYADDAEKEILGSDEL